MKFVITILAIVTVYRSASAFTTPQTHSTTSTALFANPLISRKNVLQTALSRTIAVATVATVATTQSANAVPLVATPEDSLRYVKRAIRALEKAELSATNNEYVEIRDAIRSPSLDTLRRYCGVLIENGEGTEKESLSTQYKKFVTAFEKLDNQCNLAVRGKKGVQIYDLYRSALKELVVFADTAEKVTGIPSE